MFETLGSKLGDIFNKLRGRGAITEDDVTVALRQVRVALLEADVALPAIKVFIEGVREKAVGEKVLKSIKPSQMILQIVHKELIALLSHPKQEFRARTPILLVGLQGSGKTTMAGKIAFLLKEKGKKVMLASLDVVRPAAQHQLAMIGKSIAVDTLEIVSHENSMAIAKRALTYLFQYDVLIVDTAGRLHVDSEMMTELQAIAAIVKPKETLFVADALSGQDAVRTAQAFAEKIPLTGICLSRVDGDSRGGAALSLRHCTQCPILFMGMGETPSQVLPFEPERLADRILDQGDIVGFVEKASKLLTEKEHEKEMKRLERGVFTMEDLAKKMRQIETMGGLKGILDFLPGMRNFKQEAQIDKTNLAKQLAIIGSMTPKERKDPSLLNGSRKRRIAKGSGTSVTEVNRLLDRFLQMKKMLKQFKGSGLIKNLFT